MLLWPLSLHLIGKLQMVISPELSSLVRPLERAYLVSQFSPEQRLEPLYLPFVLTKGCPSSFEHMSGCGRE